MRRVYQCLLFDLDRTLWDAERNTFETLAWLLDKYHLSEKIQAKDFYLIFDKNNDAVWEEYIAGTTTKEELRLKRFVKTLSYFGVDDVSLASAFSSDFTVFCPSMPHVLEGVHETLEYLRSRYVLCILTNGFADVQKRKLESSKLDQYFMKIFASDQTGYTKPDARMFHYAVTSLRVKKDVVLMIGDDEKVDIEGAYRYGIDQVYLDVRNIPPPVTPTYHIHNISQLKDFL